MMPFDASEVSAVCVHHDKIVKKTGNWMRSDDVQRWALSVQTWSINRTQGG